MTIAGTVAIGSCPVGVEDTGLWRLLVLAMMDGLALAETDCCVVAVLLLLVLVMVVCKDW